MKTERMGFWIPGCILIFAIALIGTAQAESGPDYAREGGYVGGGVAFGFDNFDLPSSVDPDSAYGFDVWGGYRFHPNWSTELQLEYVNGFDIDLWGFDVDAQPLTFTGNLKLYLSKERFQPFLLTGIGLGWADLKGSGVGGDDIGFAARFGGGFDLYLNESWAFQVNSSYVLQTGSLDGVDYISLLTGLQYRF